MPPMNRNEDDGDDHEDDSEGEDDEDDDEMNPMLHLPEYVVKRAEKLKDLHESRDKMMDQYLEERAALEKKFSALLQPLYDERRSVVMGEKDDEIATATGCLPPTDEAVTGVPHFWVTAISNHDEVGELVTEEDVDCLEHLQDVKCILDDDGKGFTVQFTFAPNDYFEDTILTKRYEVPNLLISDEPSLKMVQGSAIQWKDGRSLTHRTFTKKQRGKGKKAGQVRTVTKTEKKESFFNWFEVPKLPTDMDNVDEEEADAMEEAFVDDFEIAQAFRLELCPRALLWYTGEAAEEEMLQMMGSEEDGGGS